MTHVVEDSPPPRHESSPVDEGLLASIVAGNHHPYALVAPDGTIRFLSDTVQDLLGVPAHELVGRSIADVVAPESLDRAVESFQALSSQPSQPGWTGPGLTVVLRHAGGHGVPCRIHTVPHDRSRFDGMVLQIRRTEATSKLDRAIASIVHGEHVETTLAHILDFAAEHTRHSVGLIGLGADSARFATTVLHAPPPEFGGELLPLGVGPTPWGAVVDGEPQASAAVEDLPFSLRTSAVAAGMRACWAFSLNRSRPHRDVLVVWRSVPGPPPPHMVEAVERIIRLVQIALESNRTRRLLEHQAHTDELTGLPNRAALTAELYQLRARPPGAPFGVLYCDLDDFKPINDELGHVVGDRVLQIAARRIAGQVRTDDVAARIGGDEFAILCPTTDRDGLARLADRLIAAFSQPVSVHDRELRLGISIGAALIDPTMNRIDPTRVLDRADAALLRAKSAGKGRWLADEGVGEPVTEEGSPRGAR